MIKKKNIYDVHSLMKKLITADVNCGEPIPLSKGCMKKLMVKGWVVRPYMSKTLGFAVVKQIIISSVCIDIKNKR